MKKSYTDDKYSVIPNLHIFVFVLILHLFFEGVFLFFLINSYKNGGSIKSIFSDRIILTFCFLDVSILFLLCYYLSYYLARAHITEDGLYWTLFGKKIKELSWCNVADCLAFYPNNYRSPLIAFSKRPIEKSDLRRHESVHWRKDEIFFLPYKKNVLNALPPQFRPDKAYHSYEPLPSFSERKRSQSEGGSMIDGESKENC